MAEAPEAQMYTVVLERTERITFRVAAASVDDAENRYLSEGEETGSALTASEVVSVTPTPPP